MVATTIVHLGLPAGRRATRAGIWGGPYGWQFREVPEAPKLNARKTCPASRAPALPRTPTNSRPIAPCRSRSMSSIESAPATSADTFAPAAAPTPPGTVRSSPATSSRPARCAIANAGTSPAHDTKARIIEQGRPDRTT